MYVVDSTSTERSLGNLSQFPIYNSFNRSGARAGPAQRWKRRASCDDFCSKIERLDQSWQSSSYHAWRNLSACTPPSCRAGVRFWTCVASRFHYFKAPLVQGNANIECMTEDYFKPKFSKIVMILQRTKVGEGLGSPLSDIRSPNFW